MLDCITNMQSHVPLLDVRLHKYYAITCTTLIEHKGEVFGRKQTLFWMKTDNIPSENRHYLS